MQVRKITFDKEISSYIHPGLTTIHQDKLNMGETAAGLLLKMIQDPNRSYAPVILPTKLVERNSCKPYLAIRDRGQNEEKSSTERTA